MSLADRRLCHTLTAEHGTDGRFGWQSAEKYPKVRIACITYTNAAALEIRDRCHIGNLYVSTIHDFLWDNIRQFQVELRKILCEIVNDPNGKIQNPLSDDEEEFQLLDDIQITYKEYTRILKGEISHDEVLIIAKKMFETYPKLCKIVCKTENIRYVFKTWI